MATQTIQTTRFGEVEIREEVILRFVSPILGFEHLDQYALLNHGDGSPFYWLQSMTDEALAFVVADPQSFGIDFDFLVEADVLKKLTMSSKEEMSVFTIVHIPEEEPVKMTANLLGPIVVNPKTCQALQIVLSDTDYSTQTRLIPDEVLTQSLKGA